MPLIISHLWICNERDKINNRYFDYSKNINEVFFSKVINYEYQNYLSFGENFLEYDFNRWTFWKIKYWICWDS